MNLSIRFILSGVLASLLPLSSCSSPTEPGADQYFGTYVLTSLEGHPLPTPYPWSSTPYVLLADTLVVGINPANPAYGTATHTMIWQDAQGGLMSVKRSGGVFPQLNSVLIDFVPKVCSGCIPFLTPDGEWWGVFEGGELKLGGSIVSLPYRRYKRLR